MRGILALALSLVLAAPGLVSPAWAHRLNVFASVEGGEVLVEVKFSTGRIPVSGTVRVTDADENELATYELGSDGTARFPLDRDAAAEGLGITVTTSGDHEGYWVLTPGDIARGDGTEMDDVASDASDAAMEASGAAR